MGSSASTTKKSIPTVEKQLDDHKQPSAQANEPQDEDKHLQESTKANTTTTPSPDVEIKQVGSSIAADESQTAPVIPPQKEAKVEVKEEEEEEAEPEPESEPEPEPEPEPESEPKAEQEQEDKQEESQPAEVAETASDPGFKPGVFAKPHPTRWQADERKTYGDALVCPDEYDMEYRIQGRQILGSSLKKAQPILGETPGFDASEGPLLLVVALVRCRCTRDVLPVLAAIKAAYPRLNIMILFSQKQAAAADSLIDEVPKGKGLVYAVDDEDDLFAETVLSPAMQPESGLPKGFLLDEEHVIQWHGHPEATKTLVKVISKMLGEKRKEITVDDEEEELEQEKGISDALPKTIEDGTALDELQVVDVGKQQKEMEDLVRSTQEKEVKGRDHSSADLGALLWRSSSTWMKGYDLELPPTQRALSGDRYVFVDNSLWSQIKWTQAGSHGFMSSKNEETRENLLFFDKPLIQVRFQQGNLGNCYFCAAMAAVAFSRPEILEAAFQSSLDLQGMNHMYGALVYVAGQRQAVVVDDFLPEIGNEPAFTTSTVPELWPMVLEKAFVKSIKTYDGLVSGLSSAAMEFLTGAPSHTFKLKDIVEHDMVEELWDFLKSHARKYPMCAGTPPGVNGVLVGSHAYTLCSVEEGDDEASRVVSLRNPWGGRNETNMSKKDGMKTVSLQVFCENFYLLHINKPLRPQEDHIVHHSVAADVHYGNNVVTFRVHREGSCSFGFHQDIEVLPGYAVERYGYVYITLIRIEREKEHDTIVNHSHTFIDASSGLKSDCSGYLHTKCSVGDYLLITKNFRYCYVDNPKLRKRTRLTCYGNADVQSFEPMDITTKDKVNSIKPSTTALFRNEQEFRCATCSEYVNAHDLLKNAEFATSGNQVECVMVNKTLEQVLFLFWGYKNRRVFGYGIEPLAEFRKMIVAPGEYALFYPRTQRLLRIVKVKDTDGVGESKGEPINVQVITPRDLNLIA